MKIQKFSLKDVFLFYKTGKLALKDPEFLLAADDFFHIGFGYFKKGKLAKRVYLPLNSPHSLKESFILIEILDTKKGILFRSRYQNKVESFYLKEEELFYHLTKLGRFYTTLSVEESFLNFPFENSLPHGFSLLHFCHESLKGGGKIESIAIVADPGETLTGSYEEGLELFRFFKSLNLSIPLSFYSKPLLAKEFNSILQEKTLVHFSGHIEEKGLWLGKEFYHPKDFSHTLPPLLFLNGCALKPNLLKAFIKRQAKNIVYFNTQQKDTHHPLDKLKKFYLGLLIGYRIGDCMRQTLDFKTARLYGWMTNRFTF